jgi:hypothetical protein
MRGLTGLLLALCIGAALGAAAPSRADVSVVFGDSWGGPGRNLQAVVDGLYGAGRIDVKADFIGAKPGDPDPWFWQDNRFPALQVTLVSANGVHGAAGWYEEKGKVPVLRDNGIHDESLFDGQAKAGATAVVRFRKPVTRFGFYVIPNHPGDVSDDDRSVNDRGAKRFYTNRSFNDPGPDGTGALHLPLGGDVQALVFDLSSLKGRGSWLVCFEDDDSGALPGPPDQAQTDNDYSDLVFEVTTLAKTDVEALSFGGLKARYTR